MHYLFNGHDYHHVTATGNADILLRDFEVPVNLKEDKVILPSGVTCQYSKPESCRDIVEGNVIWDHQPFTDCDEDLYDILYDGEGNITQLENKVSYLTVATPRHLTVLRLGDKLSLCDHLGYKTEHSRIAVLVPEGYQQFLRPLWKNLHRQCRPDILHRC
jgi:hypothetical protein